MKNEKLGDLLYQYFELGVAEGREGRKHDTEAGDAQRVLSEIEAEIASIAAVAKPAKTAQEVNGATDEIVGYLVTNKRTGDTRLRENALDDLPYNRARFNCEPLVRASIQSPIFRALKRGRG